MPDSLLRDQRRRRLLKTPEADQARRADYEALCAGTHSRGDRASITFAVETTDLDGGRRDVHIAAGFGLALAELGHGVTLLPRDRWHLAGPTDVFVAMHHQVDPSFAPAGAWRVAWTREATEAWAASRHLVGFDQVICSAALASERLGRVTPRAHGVLPLGVDTELFTPPPAALRRTSTAVAALTDPDAGRAAHRALTGLSPWADVVVHGRAGRGLTPRRRKPVSYFALPDLYRRTHLVIDDLEVRDMGYGHVGSDFLAAAACGAMPVVNTRLGLHDLGFEDVPGYHDSAGLAAMLRDLRRQPDELARRASILCDQVRAEHSWQRRAEVFSSLVEEGRRTLPPAPGRAVHFFPDFSGGNPYQSLLYAGLADADAYARPIDDLREHMHRAAESPAGPGTVHLHWTTPILQRAAGPLEAGHMLDDFTERLLRFKSRGGVLVWTVHNVLPHDGRYRWAEIRLAELLVQQADLIHVLSATTVQEAAPHYTIDPDKVMVVEHSSYTGVYRDWISRRAARDALGIHEGERVLLALGGIRPYKGLSGFLDVFDRMSAEDPTLRLLVAGRPGHHPEVEELAARCEESPRVISHFAHVPDDRIQVWMKAADLAVLPYRQVLNSGTFLLAQTFGLPVLAPRTGTLRAFADEPHIRLFEPAEQASLETELRRAIAELVDDDVRRLAARESARALAESLHPATMAGEFSAGLDPVLPRRP